MANDESHDTRTTVAEDRVVAAVSLSVAGVVSGAGEGSLPESYQLPADNYVAAKRPLKIIQPHPTLTGASSVYSWAEPGVKYELPINAIFGAYPYSFTVSGPSGMTIGEFYILDDDGVTLRRPANYGVVSFDVPATGMTSFSYTVTITDQQLNTENVTVNVTVDASKYIHLKESAAEGGDGSSATPLNSFRDVWKDDVTDDTYAGKILRIHGGNYTLYGDAENNNVNVNFDGDIKPKIWVNQPGETPKFDCSQAKILYNGGNMDDSAFIGIRFENARSDVSNSHFFWTTSAVQRGIFWRNHFQYLGEGTVGNDNAACIFIPATSGSSYVIKDNTADTIEGPIYDTYNLVDSLFEGNLVSNSTSGQTHFIKGTTEYSCVRNEKAVLNITGLHGLDLMMGQTGGDSHDNEFCYNTVIMDDDANDDALRVAWAVEPIHYNQWLYRNTLIGRTRHLHKDTTEWTYEKNIHSDDLPTGSALTFIDNQVTPVSGINASGDLTGTTKESYLGTRGANISGAE